MTDAILHSLEDGQVMFFCPGCKCGHKVWVKVTEEPPHKSPIWTWNGSFTSPTFAPSIKVTWDDFATGKEVAHCCHSHVKDGVITFEADSTHSLSGKSEPLEKF